VTPNHAFERTLDATVEQARKSRTFHADGLSVHIATMVHVVSILEKTGSKNAFTSHEALY
jgi:hypothetical protein